MQKLDKDHVREVFAEYVSHYDPSDPKIRMKIDHTYRVAELCDQIGGEAGLDAELCWLSGMLHDIGRFEQIRRYHTFFDARSVNHAAFGADLLFKEGLLERFGDFTPEERETLEISIRDHNLYRLPARPEPLLSYCKVLRDADKVDIFHVCGVTPMEDIYNVTTEELRSSGVSEAVKQCFLERRAVDRTLKATAADNVVALICLVFELEYPVSRRIAGEQGYLKKMLEFQSDDPETQAWFRIMRETKNIFE